MNNLSAIAQHLLDVHEGTNWTGVTLKSTLEDINAIEASTQTPASGNTIEALLNHLTYWNRVMIQRINGIRVEVPESNGFDKSPMLSDAQWQELKQDNIRSARELAMAIKAVPEDRLTEPILPDNSSTYKNFQGTVEHIHYHLGQMVILKKLVRSMSM